jgi:hypothetical protein
MSDEQNEGNLILGAALGFFLGCLGIILAFFVIGGEKTKKGSIYGLVAAIGLGVCLGVLSAVAQIALMNM